MKILFVLDYHKKDYYTANGEFLFSASRYGADLADRITSKEGLGISMEDVGITFAYNDIPPFTPSGKLKPVTKTMGKEYFKQLQDKIVELKPELVVSLGGTSLLGLTGSKTINKVRGTLIEETYTNDEGESFDAKIIPTLSLDSVYMNLGNNAIIKADLQIIKRFIEGGEDAFLPNTGTYEWVNTYERVKEIFNYLIWHEGENKPHPEAVACDFETNTLDYWNKGAEQILFTASWEEEQGIAIPLHYSGDDCWTPEQVDEIFELINQLYMCDTYKVWANGKFDMAFSKYVHKLPYGNNNLDIQTMHFIAISEESNAKVNRGLKTLATQYTNMGGYEKPLETFRDNYVKNQQIAWEKEQTEQGIKFKKSDFQPRLNEIDGSTFSYDWIPKDLLEPYAAGDTDATLRVYHKLKPLVDDNPKWQHLIYDFYPKLIDGLTDAEVNGFKLDLDRVALNKRVYTEERKRILEEMYETVPEITELENWKMEQLQKYMEQRAIKKVADRDAEVVKATSKFYASKPEEQEQLLKFNPSPNAGDAKVVMFDLLGYRMPMEPVYYTESFIKELTGGEQAFKKNPKEVMEKLEPKYYKLDTKEALPYLIKTYDEPFAKLLMEFSKIDKLLGSFIDKFPRVADDEGFLHTRFNPHGTVTSRLSSSGAYNAQQIPRRTADVTTFQYEYGIKAMLKSRFESGVIINSDFTSIEVYISALLSNDHGLTQALLDGRDIHKDTASKAFGVDYDEVTKEQRSAAKAVN